MQLYINSIKDECRKIEVLLVENGKIIKRVTKASIYKQAELLLKTIDNLLEKNRLKITDIDGIFIRNKGGSFTSLRIGIVTANALGYSLGIPVKSWDGTEISVITPDYKPDELSIVNPSYSSKPNITIKKRIF